MNNIFDTLKNALTACYNRLCSHDEQSVPEMLEAESALKEAETPPITLYDFLVQIEKNHCRTEHDLGTNFGAITIINMMRDECGLEPLSLKDFPKYDGFNYVMPENSKLIVNQSIENEWYRLKNNQTIQANDMHSLDSGVTLVSIKDPETIGQTPEHFSKDRSFWRFGKKI